MKKQSVPILVKAISARSVVKSILKISAGILLIFLVVACPNKEEDGLVPTLTTSDVIAVTSTAAISGGNITNDGDNAITARGLCWSTTQDPELSDANSQSGNGMGSFSGNIKGLAGNTTYYVKAYATNSNGTGYGNERSFTTSPTITDVDGIVYSTVVIGTQTWMAENLKTTSYRNGDPITHLPDTEEWGNATTGAYCFCDNETGKEAIYGKFYNWYALEDSRKIAPEGWHVPTDEEWTTLIEYLGGMDVAGEKMRETGTEHWLKEYDGIKYDGGSNTSGFTALGAGHRKYNFESYDYLLWGGFFWCNTEKDADAAFYVYLDMENIIYRAYWAKTMGLSIRCVKD